MGRKRKRPSDTGTDVIVAPKPNPGHFKKGHSGNPKGRPPGARDSLTTLFLRDLKASWEQFGVPALVAAAWSDPLGYVRVVAGLVPKEIEVTVTQRTADEVDDDRLASIATSGSEDFAGTPENPEVLQPLGEAYRH